MATRQLVPSAVLLLGVIVMGTPSAAPAQATATTFQVDFSNQTDVTAQLYFVDAQNKETLVGEMKPGGGMGYQLPGLQNDLFRFKVNGQKLVDYTINRDTSQQISIEKSGFTGASFTPNVFARSSFLRPWNKEQKQLLGLTTDQGNTGSADQGNIGSNLSAQEVQDVLDFHTRVCAEVGVGPLTWSPTAARAAQQWADAVVRTGVVEHNAMGYGQNIAWGWGSDYNVLKGAQRWYNEKQSYTPGTVFNGQAGHYTQMVWRNSTEIGVSKATIQTGQFKGQLVFVANYNPAGNSFGTTPY